MKKRNAGLFARAALAALAGLCLPAVVAAAEPGAAAADFLKNNPSPRGSGMGEACTAATQDAYAAWWNPAGLALLERHEVAATHQLGFEGVTSQFVSGAYTLGYGRTVGVHLIRQSVVSFDGYDASGGFIGSIEASQSAMGASYAQTLWKDEIEKPILSVGGTVKRVSELLDNVPSSAIGFDLGAIYHLRPSQYWKSNRPAQELRLAVAVRNLGAGLKYDSLAFPLPQATAVGLAWVTHPGGPNTLTTSADFTMTNSGKAGFSLGAEYFMYGLFALRGGFNSGQDTGTGARFGLGYRLDFVDIDYSMSPFGELGFVQKIGAVFRFGSIAARQPLAGATARIAGAKTKAKKEKVAALKGYASDYLAQAGKNLAAREYTIAADNLTKAFNLDRKSVV